MKKIKPLPISIERFKKLCKAFLIFSARTGVKVVITIEPKEEEKCQKKN